MSTSSQHRPHGEMHPLQAALSLGRLRQMQGRGAEARARLEPVLAWFSEGYDRPDLVEARAVLADLL